MLIGNVGYLRAYFQQVIQNWKEGKWWWYLLMSLSCYSAMNTVQNSSPTSYKRIENTMDSRTRFKSKSPLRNFWTTLQDWMLGNRVFDSFFERRQGWQGRMAAFEYFRNQLSSQHKCQWLVEKHPTVALNIVHHLRTCSQRIQDLYKVNWMSQQKPEELQWWRSNDNFYAESVWSSWLIRGE